MREVPTCGAEVRSDRNSNRICVAEFCVILGSATDLRPIRQRLQHVRQQWPMPLLCVECTCIACVFHLTDHLAMAPSACYDGYQLATSTSGGNTSVRCLRLDTDPDNCVTAGNVCPASCELRQDFKNAQSPRSLILLVPNHRQRCWQAGLQQGLQPPVPSWSLSQEHRFGQQTQVSLPCAHDHPETANLSSLCALAPTGLATAQESPSPRSTKLSFALSVAEGSAPARLILILFAFHRHRLQLIHIGPPLTRHAHATACSRGVFSFG